MKEKKWLERTGIDMNVGKVGTGENRRLGEKGTEGRAREQVQWQPEVKLKQRRD